MGFCLFLPGDLDADSPAPPAADARHSPVVLGAPLHRHRPSAVDPSAQATAATVPPRADSGPYPLWGQRRAHAPGASRPRRGR